MDYNRLCLGCFKENKSGMAVCPYCGFEEKSYNEQAVKKMCLPAGTILQGRYLIGKVLGAGGFGITYLAFQMNLNRVVAIKELFPADVVMRSGQTSSTGLDFKLKVSGAGSMELFEKTLSGFETEGQNLASINLPGVVGIYDCFRDNSTAYLVMEYVSGQNLKEYQKEHGGRLEEKELLGLLEPVIRSMATIHDIGIIHRDISPDNLILNDKGELILVDFGAARSVAGVQDDEGKSLTVVLKQGYTPLEQYSSHGVQGPWTDVYALCATIYSLLTGRLSEEASIRIQDNNTDEDIKKTLSEAGVSRKTADAVTAGLKLLYSDRTQNMTDLWKALYGKAGGQDSAPSVAAKESIKAGGTKKSKKKGPFILLILLAGVIAVGAFLVHRNLEIKRESERQELERIAVEQAEAGKAESEKRAREKEQSEAESERKAKAKAESESESEKIARAKAESESESEKAARLQAEWERAAKEKAESEAESERKARVKAESESESERMARAKAESEAESARVAEKKKESEAESEQKAKKKEESEAESEKKAKEKAESEAESEKKAREKTESEAELRSRAEQNFGQAEITYTFGSQTEKIDWNVIRDWVIMGNDDNVLREDRIRKYVRDLAARVNTCHCSRQFHTSTGTDITITDTGNEYGYTVDEEGEYQQLVLDIQSNSRVTREPVYSTTGMSRDGMDDLQGTYIEINLSLQHLWFYKDYRLITESDLVSGCVTKNMETQTGCFPIAYKESPAALNGQNALNGWRTDVDYWMPFTEEQGMYDASWRSEFGGNVYVYDGTNGCVDLPHSAAQEIYDNLDPGTAVILYK